MRLSTSVKVASGYLLLILLLIVSVSYIHQQMKQLSLNNGTEQLQSERQHLTHRIVSELYAAEVIGQTLSAGQPQNYWSYRKAMKKAHNTIDSLRTLLKDSVQQLRLDTVRILLQRKESNTRHLLAVMQDNEPEKLYSTEMEQLIRQQDSILGQQHVRKKVITRKHTSFSVEKKKGFFKRLAAVFAPGKGDSTEVRNIIQEEYVDTLTEAYNLVDTVAHLLHGIQNKVYETRQQQTAQINRRIYLVQLAGTQLSTKVNQLLEDIETEEQLATEQKMQKEQLVRRDAARIMAGIAALSVLLAIFFFTLVWRDISRSNHYRNELEKAKQRAEDLLAAREKLMLTITHDIKAPVGSIIGYTELLERLLNEKRARFYLDNMKSSAQHLLRLVTSLLDFYRLDVRKMDVHKVTFNPYELMESIADSFLPLAEKKGIQLTKKLATPLRTTFEGDPFRIRQITENLLSNALKFTKEGNIALGAAYENAQLHLTVSDTGCGMTPDEQKKIFQEFTRLRNAQEQEGFGLGLAITQKLVLLLDGRIEVQSEPGKGSSFHVFIPLGDPVKQEDQTNENKVKAELPPSLRLLLIDDDRIQLSLTKSMLQNLCSPTEHEQPLITCCTSPQEVFDELAQRSYQLVLTDIQMPAMNGFELLQAIRQRTEGSHPQLPVIAITARGDIDEEDFKRQGFAGCLHKPFSLYELYGAIRSVIGSTDMPVTPAPPANPVPPSTETDTHPAESSTTDKTASTPPDALSYDSLLAFSADDEEAAREIITTFITETEHNLERFCQALEEKDMATLCNLAHKMLPTLTMVKATPILPSLKWLEAQRNSTLLTEQAVTEAQKVAEYTRYVIRHTRERFHC